MTRQRRIRQPGELIRRAQERTKNAERARAASDQRQGRRIIQQSDNPPDWWDYV